MLELTVTDPKTNQPFAFTIVNNHLKSLRGVDDPKDGQNVRMKKKLQAEFLAKWVNERQKASPSERILLVGDFNAFPFSDGLVDQIGTIIGKPAPRDSVIESSPDLVETDLINLVNLIRADQQYSYTFDGNAQVLDHFIANFPMRKHLAGFGYLRINADYPQILRAVSDRPERFSDHDVAVGYFNFDASAAAN
jgi:predicted extracellular nuclease